MQTTHVRHIFNIHRLQKLIIVLISSAFCLNVSAQRNVMEHYNRKIYFGITLGYNMSNYKVVHSSDFVTNDSILEVNSRRGPGFNLGIISNLKLNNYFDLRFVPALVFADKKIIFTQNNKEITKTTESIYTEFPIMIRFKSQPWKDMKVYVLAGMKYSLDLSSNAKARKAFDQIKIKRNDLSYEYGLGLQFFFPLFIFSPELKFSNGVFNVHQPDRNLIYSNMLDRLNIRTITISLHFEG
jgi:opacity protein-like surface antigen